MLVFKGSVNFVQFVKNISCLSNTAENDDERIAFSFYLFDINEDGFIDREELKLLTTAAMQEVLILLLLLFFCFFAFFLIPNLSKQIKNV